MKIVHTSDWHIGKAVGEHSMLEDQRCVLNGLVSFLKEERADALLVAGDLYDRSVPSAEAVELADEILTRITGELGIPVLAIAGNHDSRVRLSFAGSLLRKQKLFLAGSLAEAEAPVTLEDENGPVDFYLLPYFRLSDVRPLFPEETLKTEEDAYNAVLERIVRRLDRSRRNVLVSHGFFGVSAAGKTERVLSSELSVGGSDFICSPLLKEFDYTALGHLHAPQKAGAETVRYAGSLLKYSVDEATQSKSILVVECNAPGETKVIAHRLPVRRDLRIVKGRFDEILEAAKADPHTEDYVFAQLEQSEPELEAMERLRRVYPNVLGLRYAGRLEVGGVSGKSVAALGRQSPEEIFRDFYREISGEDISENKRQLAHEFFEAIRAEERR